MPATRTSRRVTSGSVRPTTSSTALKAAPGAKNRFTTTPHGPTWLKRGPQKEHVHANPHQ